MQKKHDPPKLAQWLLRFSTKSTEKFSILGDYEEEFKEIYRTDGSIRACAWYWRQTLNSTLPFLIHKGFWRCAMIQNYLKVAFRNIRRHKGYSFINIAGLAIGMACCILLVLYIHSELNIDGYHDKGNRIFRLCVNVNIGGTELIHSSSNALAAEALRDEYPEVENAVRFRGRSGAYVIYKDKESFIQRIVYADDSVFELFTWPMIKGDPGTALSTPYAIVLTEDAARGCFGDEDPLGKILRFNDEEQYTVTGIIENMPQNATMIYDAICSFKTVYELMGVNHPALNDWLSFNFRTDLLLKEGIDYKVVNDKISGLLERKDGERLKAKGATEELFLHPLRNIYLRPLGQEVGPIHYVYIFSVVAIFILLIACVNFMNLATARSANRSREVGMRKVFGAFKNKLVSQFLSEALLLSVLSLIIAVILVQLALPQMNSFTRLELSFNPVEIPWLLPGLIGLTLIVGILAGSYPAFFLSGFQPVKVLCGRLKSGSSNTRLRRILVVVQFTISVTLIIGTGLIIHQLNYMKNKDAGFNKEHVIVIRASERSTQRSLPVIKEEFKSHPRILKISASSTIPGGGFATNDKIPEGYTVQQTQLMDEMNVDVDFISTLGMELVAGRDFSKEFGTDAKASVIINETAVKRFGWDDAVGKTIRASNPYGRGWVPRTVIGVVKDFHLRTMDQVVEPIYMGWDPDFPYSYNFLDNVVVRISPKDISSTLDFIENKWLALFPDEQFNYSFLDESFNNQFQTVERSREIFSYFTLLAIFIGCLGLLGLASFTTEQRTKEIGIRKVLGSSTPGIIMLLSKELLILVVIANVVAWPAAYFLLQRWLQGFPYRISVTVFPFVLSALLVLVISFSTVAFQAIRAALANPVEALKYE